MSLIIPANTLASGGYAVDNSCRFNSAGDDKMDRTIESPTLGTKFTFSTWIKKDLNGDYHHILTSSANPGNFDIIRFDNSDNLQVIFQGGGDTLTTDREFRDVAAWYNIVVAVDTTQGTAANRVKIYINGTQETSFSTETYPDQNLIVNYQVSGKTLRIGANTWDTSTGHEKLGGVICETVFIDGVAHAPTDFGEFDEDSGIWKPIDISGLTFGNNGFYLDYQDSSALGNDVSGNNNDFSTSGLTAIDQSTDTCTNNWSTINAVAVAIANVPTLSDGNLTALSTSGANASIIGNMAVSSGIWYYELKWLSGTSGDFVAKVGWGNPDVYPNMHTASIVYRNSDGKKYIDNTGTSYGATWTSAGDIIGVLLDLDSGTKTIRFYKNDADQGAITLSGAIDDGTFFIPYLDLGNTDKVSFNFGSPPYAISSGNTDANGYGNFEFSTKGGYALNTKNLAEYG